MDRQSRLFSQGSHQVLKQVTDDNLIKRYANYPRMSQTRRKRD